MYKYLFAAMLAVSVNKAHAEFFTGNMLLNLLQSTEVIDRIHGLGYIQGVFDAYSNITICPPANVTAGQVRDMIKNYLENNPAIRNKTADIIIRDAFKLVWPCRNNNSRSGV